MLKAVFAVAMLCLLIWPSVRAAEVPISMVISATSEVVKRDEDVKINLVVANNSAGPIEFFHQMEYSVAAPDGFSVIGPDGAPAALLAQRPSPSTTNVEVLQPGEEAHGWLNVNAIFDMARAGIYKIQFAHGVVAAGSVQKLSSNVIYVTVM